MELRKVPFYLLAALSAAMSANQPPALAQGTPHLSVTPAAVRTIVPRSLTITADMCQPADTYCLQHAVGHAYFTGNLTGIGTDAAGNVYFMDTGTRMLGKVSLSGKITFIAGRYNQSGGLAPQTTSAATNLVFGRPSDFATDLAGNVYVADNSQLIKISPLGVATRLTGDAAVSRSRTDGAPASTQAVNPFFTTTDLQSNVYLYDQNTCTIDEILATTGAMKVVAGTLVNGCNGSSGQPTNGQAANTYSFGGFSAMAIGADQTVYLSGYKGIYSVSPSGTVTVLAPVASYMATAGVVGSGGDIGSPFRSLSVDPIGNLYYTSQEYDPNSGNFLFKYVELVKATNSVAILGGLGEGYTGDPDGTPSDLASLQGIGYNTATDSLGRYLYGITNGSVSAFDRNGSAVFDTNTNQTQRTLTFTNTGTGTLTGVNFGGTGYPYALSPTQAELTAESAPGAPPFSVDTTSGTCLTLFGGGSFSLAPGASCTVVIDYNSNTSVPNAGSFTLYTNDPLGPVTVSLSATAVTDGTQIGTNNTLAVSTTTLSPSASVSLNGSFTVNASMISNIGGSYAATPTTPTGSLSIGVTNNATGVQTVHTASLTAGTTTGTATATTSFSGLAPGTYSLQAVYPGDGTSAANYSPVQTLYVQRGLIDYTTFAMANYHQPYVGATPQFLNFSSLGYTIPQPVEFQDKFAGNGTVGFTLFDPNNNAVDTTSATPLAAGKYTLVPSVASAASFGYSVTPHPATFFIAPADLTVRGNYVNVPYGEYYVPAGVTVPSGGTALNLPLTIETAPPSLSSDEAANPSALNAITLSATIDGQPTNAATMLPVGHYTVRAALAGNGAGNYSLTALTGPVVIRQANLTINAQYTNVRYGQVSGTNYTSSNIIETSAAAAQTDVTAGRLTIGTTANGTPDSFGYLPVGHYTLTPTVSGSAVGNYSLTANSGSLVVQPADLTLNMASYTATGSLTVNGQNLCHACYTAPNTSLLFPLAINLIIQGTGSTSFNQTVVLGSSTPSVTLLPGTYTVTPSFSNPNYSLTVHPGTLTVN